MVKHYELNDESFEDLMVQDDSVLEYAIRERMDSEVLPYTMEELNQRIDEAEAEFDAGLGIPSDQVFSELRNYIVSRL